MRIYFPLLSVFFFTFVLITSEILAQEVKPEDISARTTPSCCILQIQTADGKTVNACAFLVKDGIAVTAWNMVNSAKAVTAKFPNGEEFESSGVIDKDEKRNVALIRIKEFGKPLVASSAADPSPGDKVSCALVKNGAFGVVEASISGIQHTDSIKFYQISSDIPDGNNGGAVLNSKGEAIGILSHQTIDGKETNIAIPIAYALALDSTLVTQPWSQQKTDNRVSVQHPNSTSSDEIDKKLVEAYVAMHDFTTAYLYADFISSGNGYHNGVPQTFYASQQAIDSNITALSAIATADTSRMKLISESIQILANLKTSGEYFIKAIVIAQDAKWGAQSTDLWKRSKAIIVTIPSEQTEFLKDVKTLSDNSPAFKNALPEDMIYYLRIEKRPSGYGLAAVPASARDQYNIILVIPGTFASKMGLRTGDKLISSGDMGFKPEASLEAFKILVKNNLGKKLDVVIERNGKQAHVSLNIPKEIPKEDIITD
jgi:S1-C subfamily serine protease